MLHRGRPPQRPLAAGGHLTCGGDLASHYQLCRRVLRPGMEHVRTLSKVPNAPQPRRNDARLPDPVFEHPVPIIQLPGPPVSKTKRGDSTISGCDERNGVVWKIRYSSTSRGSAEAPKSSNGLKDRTASWSSVTRSCRWKNST